MPESRALIVGEALVDVVEHTDGSRTEHPGGSPANVAVGLARLGRSVDLLTWLGPDAHGARLRAHMFDEGVRVLPGDRGASRTAVALARLDEAGAATYSFDLEWDLPGAWPEQDQPPLVMHTGSIAATLPPGADAVASLATRLRETSTITYDPNVRPLLMGSPAIARGPIERLVALADVVKVSDEDLGWLYPDTAAAAVAAEWLTRGPAIVVVTQGGAGARGFTASGRDVAVSAVSDFRVVDTVGAGDSFMSGLIDGLWSTQLLGAHRRNALRDLSTPSLAAILQRCAHIAALTVSRAGANPPHRTELRDAMELSV